ncbi:hypothetical protein NUH88_10485 [Nisaea acidiphila]|uniref:Uncharacterized protein n=1 Tax=Nisaea acidiphila TaxID=1862145 RepID=A0A9J7B392_9PROT|nr:hypothetical protein [Nisaea acidiphila]UUX52109.1 hypothetical protein NUH88_10485 [Nisaea acidiphila]
MGRYKKAISQLEAELRHRCHRYYVESGIRKYKFASAAGISDTLLKGIDAPDFEASLKTLQRLDEVIPEEWEPASDDPGEQLIVPASNDPVIGYKIWESDLSRSRKIYVRDDLLHGLDPDQVERCAAYIDKVRDPDGRLLETRFKIDVLRALAPQCAIHVFDVGEDDPSNFFIEHWDNGTGFWKGADMTGMKFAELDDEALRGCQLEDYLVCRETQWPNLAIVQRNYAHGEERKFLRLLFPFEAKDGSPKILSITRPQSKGLALDLLQKKLPGYEQIGGEGVVDLRTRRS